ncbi:MAG: tryptophan 7-halogenase [Sphingomonadaceae bacterium]|nr:tryptophan 7-halogenase [Sphingomonadaceae bacterium]
MSGRPIASIAVVGGGVAGWSAAAAFAARLKGVSVTVVADPAAPPALVDLIATAGPSITDFHHDLGLDERALLRRVDGVFRLGAAFAGWGPAPYLHTHGEHGEVVAAAPFHHHWLRLDPQAGAFGDFSPASVLAAAGRFVHPSDDPASPLARFNYGLTLDPAAYAETLRRFAMVNGVAERAGPARPAIGGDGRVAHLDLPGGRLTADLYVDTTGVVADTVAPAWIDWSRWLPVAWLAVGEEPAAALPPSVETVTATATGWRLTASLRGRGIVAEASTEPLPGGHRLRSGRRAAAWTGNVAAVGEAAVALEPLDGVALHLVQAHADRIVALLPDTDFAAVELADFNRQTAAEAERLRDLLALRYATSRRGEPLWRDLAATAPSDGLAHDLTLFRERGHLPLHDGESFAPDSWLAVLIGQGVRPRRVDPVAAGLPLAEAHRILARLRAAVTAAAATAPTHRDYLARFLEGR